MKRTMITIAIIIVVTIIACCIVYSQCNYYTRYCNKTMGEVVEFDKEMPIAENKSDEPVIQTLVYTQDEPVVQTHDTGFHSYMSCDWDANESYELCKIAMAEATGEDIEGKALIMMVVLNRVMDSRFPNTIHDVIFQKNQFSPTSDGRYYKLEPNEDCWKALNMIMVDKWDKSQGALYFENQPNPNNWHSRNLQYLFKHGNHRFYK